MALDISVRFSNVRREANRNVAGSVKLEVSALGNTYQIDGRDFNFPEGGEQQIYDQDFGPVKVTASVYERPAGQCCIRGHVHVSTPIGGGIGKDLDENCTPIPT
ncbi:hypothetical protein [Methylobacterium sp. SyP6R]|uniref:hypothetical protein n=1 Tax=Methylobacterium sp. SyP6R TaxID=2718876 RepID=UPI001F44A41C|nr:hypothetical protein [Methylobacterium sp. SyP6R]MCF4130320.1 hypothetical protein [Methylobacterium sp. SyP6R]